ncbi:MAG: C-terminal helicase domain-containing protein, partial [Thermodesulfobacteriota bacterium]
LDELADLLDELCLQSGLKAVVFSQWEAMTRMVEARLRRMGLGSVRLHGGVPTASRGALMDRFREDDAVQVFISTDAGGVGLNLQNASVLINLDVPWNPAILEQRNARVHRLGQTRTVQIITMVAADSYEERVFGLVQNKQLLFDNVIGDDASEDVLGISKKLLETLIEDLSSGPVPAARAEAGELSGAGEEEVQAPAAPGPGGKAPEETALEEGIRQCIVGLQEAFGPRIERIFGSGGGLVAVLDRVDAEADEVAARLSGLVPVALIDRFSLKGLQRLGAVSPVAESCSYFQAHPEVTPAPGALLLTQAQEKLAAARLLLAQNLATSALDLLAAALLAAAAGRAGREKPLTPQDAGVWLYGEAMPKGILGQEEVGLVLRGISLAQCPAVPENLVQELAQDVACFVGA